MDIIEVKNNLVKLCYEEDILLSSLILIKDESRSYIAQVLHLEATRTGKVAVAKIIFNYDNGIYAYDGSIPSLRSRVEIFPPDLFTNYIEHSDPVVLGKITGTKENLTVGVDVLKENPIILSEKFYVTKSLLNNFAIQLQARKEKIIVFDTAGMFKNNRLSIAKDFKLPLNSSLIDYIYEYGFADATDESKAMIKSIFDELREYSKTVDFIPFDTFKAVVDSEFTRTKLLQLVILKNKIKQFDDWGVFAQKSSDYDVLKTKIEGTNTIVIDISKIKPSLRKECIKFVYSVMKGIDSEFYAFTPLSSDSSDELLLKELRDIENVHTTLICDYDYSNLNELKKYSKNMLMFSPLKQQKDYGGYNVLLQKLAEDEFIAYGKMTKFVPIICRMAQISPSDVYVPKVAEPVAAPVVEMPAETVAEESAVEETPVDVSEVTEVQGETDAVSEGEAVDMPEENIEADGDSPEEAAETVGAGDEQTAPEENEGVSEVTDEETPVVNEDEEISEASGEQNIEEEPVAVETVETAEIEEIQTPVAETIETPEVTVDEVEQQTVAETPVEDDIQADNGDAVPTESVQEALEQVPELDEEEELSDDDLDMIEKLSKPDEEIEAINEPAPESVPTQEPEVETLPAEAETPVAETPTALAAEETPVEEQVDSASDTVPVVDEALPEEAVVQDEESVDVPPEQNEALQTRANTTPVVPEYKADFPDEDRVNSDPIGQGDRVIHEEFGEGVVEKMINYGDKILCSVNFASVGRRLLNPDISEMKKI